MKMAGKLGRVGAVMALAWSLAGSAQTGDGKSTGTLDVQFTSNGQPLQKIGVVELRTGGKMVNALAEPRVKFQAVAGSYALRIHVGSSQHLDVDGFAIAAGETTTKSVEVPCAFLGVTAKGGRYAQGARPYVAVLGGGKLVAALVDSPAKFQLLAGRYSVCVLEDGKKLGLQNIAVQAGRDQNIELDVTAPNAPMPEAVAAQPAASEPKPAVAKSQHPDLAAALLTMLTQMSNSAAQAAKAPPPAPPKKNMVAKEKPWPPKTQAGTEKPLRQKVQVLTNGGELTARARGETTRKPVPAGEYELVSGTILEAAKAPVHLIFPSNGRIALDAGARIRVGLFEDGILVAQQAGQTWHRVERPKNKAFFYTVVTPKRRFTALGTDFGVEIKREGSYVCVYEGNVVSRGTVTDDDGHSVPVYEWIPDGIRCQPPPESSAWQTSGDPAVHGTVHEDGTIRDSATGELLTTINTVDADAAPTGVIHAGQEGSFGYRQEDRNYPVDGSAPFDSQQQLAPDGGKPVIGTITTPSAWAALNHQFTHDARELEREHNAGRISDADFWMKLRLIIQRGRYLAEHSPDYRFNPNGGFRVHRPTVQHIQHIFNTSPEMRRTFNRILPGGVARFSEFADSIPDDWVVPLDQRPYAMQLMRLLGVPFTTDP